MNDPTSVHDLLTTAPMTVVTATALLVLIVEAIRDKTESITFWLALAGLGVAAAYAVSSVGATGTAYGGMVRTGGGADFFAFVFCVSGILTVMLSKAYLRRQGIEHGEFYAILLLAVVGMMLMASSEDLVIFFLGLELMSICFYILAGFARRRITSNEAALKYLLLGAFATGFLLYGIALVYGSTGTTSLPKIIAQVQSLGSQPLFLIGLGLLLIGLAFKVAAVPFHMWAPDVYEGSPTTVSGFMATGGKAAAFSAFLIIFAPSLVQQLGTVRESLAALAALSMIVGNILALVQNNLKRMLAYSSIAHAGYILTGVVAANALGAEGVLYYALAYTVMNVSAFGVLSIVETGEGNNLSYDDYAGLSTSHPVLAGLMALFMFSLAGIPPFAGFFGKYYVFAGAVSAGYTWLAIVGVLMSVVSAYYDLRLVVVMYFRALQPAPGLVVPIPALALIALVLSAAGIVGMGVFPSSVLGLTHHLF